MLALRDRCGDIVVAAAGLVDRSAALVGSCVEDEKPDAAGC
jgi:hypothetical protein